MGVDRLLLVQMKHARAGMTLALPVRNPVAPERCLLAAGYELKRRDITRLEQLGVREMMVRYPGLEQLDRFINPRIVEQRGQMLTQLRGHFERAQAGVSAQLPYERYVQEMASLVEELLRTPSSIVLIDQADGKQPWLMRHSIDVAYLSVMMGLKLESYLIRQRPKLSAHHARDVSHLGLGGMLHDVGLLGLEPETLERYAETHDATEPGFAAHVHLGYERVHGRVEPSSAAAVLHHHQCFDGSGFPQRRGLDGTVSAMSGEQIHVFARIVAAADVFCEMRQPYECEPIPTVRALRRLVSGEVMRRLDPNAVRALLQVVPPFSPAMPVRLNDGRWAVPLEHRADRPCRPRVQVISLTAEDPYGDAPDPSESVVDLAERPELRIVEAEGQDVSGDEFEPPDMQKLIYEAEEEAAVTG